MMTMKKLKLAMNKYMEFIVKFNQEMDNKIAAINCSNCSNLGMHIQIISFNFSKLNNRMLMACNLHKILT